MEKEATARGGAAKQANGNGWRQDRMELSPFPCEPAVAARIAPKIARPEPRGAMP
jgi:hypothetical protein